MSIKTNWMEAEPGVQGRDEEFERDDRDVLRSRSSSVAGVVETNRSTTTLSQSVAEFP